MSSLENSPIKLSPVKGLPVNVDTCEDFFSEGLINYLISASYSKPEWFMKSTNVQNIISSFLELRPIEQRLYARLFARQNAWIKLKNISYFFVKDLQYSISLLESQGFLTSDISEENIKDILQLLEKEEVKTLCKEQKVDLKGNKSDMVQRLTNRCKTQRTIMFFSNALSSEDIILKSAKKYLNCVKLTPEPRLLFRRLVLLLTYPHFRGEESKRVSALAKTLYEKNKGLVMYHKYGLRPVDVFTSLSRFEQYEESLIAIERFFNLKEKKDWKSAALVVSQSKVELKKYLEDSSNMEHLEQLKCEDRDYLMKFTGGRGHAYVLSKGVEVLKKEKASWSEAIEILNLLLGQSYFLRGERGYWFKELALIYEKMKNLEQVTETLVAGLTDPVVLANYSTVGLILKAESMSTRKAQSEAAKQRLRAVIPVFNYVPKTISIMATAAPSVTKNFKQIFVKDTANGKEYPTVEKVAEQHYMSEFNYKSVIHDEGSLLVNCVVACFWEVVFADVEGVFHSELQMVPLDWASRGFYHRRVEEIERLSKDISNEGAAVTLEKFVNHYKGVMGPISWGLFDSLSEAQEFLECIGTEEFLKICHYLLEDFRSRRSGLPDLTMWDVKTKKCALVEVKGPSDTLSPNQVRWLEKLTQFGVQAQVCRVNTLNTGPRDSNKRKVKDISPDGQNIKKNVKRKSREKLADDEKPKKTVKRKSKGKPMDKKQAC